MYLVNFFSEADYGLPEGKIFFGNVYCMPFEMRYSFLS